VQIFSFLLVLVPIILLFCAQYSGGRPMVRQKRGHPARFEVRHRNGIKQSAVKIFQKVKSSENQLLREAVNYDPELETPHKRPRYQLLDNG